MGKDLRINEHIVEKEVLVIQSDNQRKVMSLSDALLFAQSVEQDLVEVSPSGRGKHAVCKVIDYGKYRFDQDKHQRETKRRQKQVKLKEIRMQPKISSHDLEFKTKHIMSFLNEGNKVKVTIRFRGRELAHTEIGERILRAIMNKLQENADIVMEKNISMEGRFMSMIVAPKKK